MPRRFEPAVELEWEWGYDNPFPHPIMKESAYGEWVKLSTYNDVYNQLTSANQRMQHEVHSLRQRLKELESPPIDKRHT